MNLQYVLLTLPLVLQASEIDLALSSNAAGFFQHPVLGGPSYDALFFSPTNPAYTGSGSQPWVVNGFLYALDPPNATQLCILASEYPRGYSGSSQMRAVYSNDTGSTWVPGPVAVAPNASMFDHGGLTPDGSAVVEEGSGHTYIVYDWGSPPPSGPGLEGDGGLGLAEGPLRGPFTRSPQPIVQQSTMPPIPDFPNYRMVYGGTLLKRAGDWLILAAISTKNNGGGMWGLCCLTASDPHGPWSSPPTLLLVPQSPLWHPHPVEFYPAFAHGGWVFAPATSLASPNRNYQVIFRAPLGTAHLPGSWAPLQEGSAMHWEAAPGPGGASIWGQTFSAFVHSSGGGSGSTLRLMYPSLNPGTNVGALNLASAPWSDDTGMGQRPRGFWLSAPGTPALAITTGTHDPALELDVVVVGVVAEGNVGGGGGGGGSFFSLLWNSDAPLGSVGWPFPSGGAPTSWCNASALAIAPSGGWELLVLPPAPSPPSTASCTPIILAHGLGCGATTIGPLHIHVTQSAAGVVNVSCNGGVVAAGVGVGRTPLGGRVGLKAEAGTALNVSGFTVGGWSSGSSNRAGASSASSLPPLPPLTLLAIEGLNGYGTATPGWREDGGVGVWRSPYGGYVCDSASPCQRAAKFNIVGVGVVYWAPRGLPGAGNVSLSIDGGAPVMVDLSGGGGGGGGGVGGVMPSSPLWTSPPLPSGRHALVITAPSGVTLPLDNLDVLVAPVVAAA